MCKKKKGLGKAHGLDKDGRMYFWPDAIYHQIIQQNGYQGYTKNKISKELKSDGVLILEYDMASDNTVHLEVNGERLRFLCLDESLLYHAAKEY